ncbi:MAG: MotA/TolQ/ExbB proton channel family protein, partial [Gammaproteobacteria bacterium HGW-Gammaproteobacteria-6]
VLMFVLYQLQLMQERLVLDANSACDRNLIQHLQTR